MLVALQQIKVSERNIRQRACINYIGKVVVKLRIELGAVIDFNNCGTVGLFLGVNLRHIDVTDGKIDQDAREVRTKFSKSFVTTFFPVGDDIRAVVADWVAYLRTEKLWCHDDALFPATKVAVGKSLRFEVAGLDRKHWSSAGPIRTIFKEAFASVGLPYFNPHSFRKTLALLGGQRCKTPEEYKAWSQNLGHENVLTTFCSYGDVSHHRQIEIIRSFA